MNAIVFASLLWATMAQGTSAALDSLLATATVTSEPGRMVVAIPLDVMFAPDGILPSALADPRLDDLADYYRSQPARAVVVACRGDGSDESALWLRQKRAGAVRKSLIVRGIPAERIRVANVAAAPVTPSIEVTFER